MASWLEIGKLSQEDGPDDDEREFPLSYGQRALWFLDRMAPGNPAYVIAGAARIRGRRDRVDPAAFRRAATALAARHPGLRTTFHDGPDGAVQRVGSAPLVDFVLEDYAAADASELSRRLSELAYRPFDLARGPLWRVVLLRLGEEGYALALSIHHVVADFWSLGVMLRDLGTLYSEASGEPAVLLALPPLRTTFAAVVRREAESFAGEEGERLWSFWRGALAGRPLVLDLPTDHPRSPSPAHRRSAQTVALPPAVAEALRRLTRRRGATLYMGVLAAFEVLLHRYSGQDRLLVGCPTSGRQSAELTGLVGYLVNPVAIPGDLAGDPPFSEHLERVRGSALRSFAHRDYPLPLLAERLQPEREAGVSPIFQVMCVLQKGRRAEEEGLAALAVGEAGGRMSLGPLALETLAIQAPGAQFDLSLALAETPRGLSGRLAYDRDLFEAATVTRMAGHLETLLTALAGTGERSGELPEAWASRLSALPLLSAAETHQLVGEWCGEERRYTGNELLHELFVAQAAVRPGEPALGCAGEWMTYGELDARSDQLAARLAAVFARTGGEREPIVGVCLSRSFDLLVGVIGLLKAGGVYLPLDPALPAERLAFLVADAGVAAILAEEATERLLDTLPGGSAVPRLRVGSLETEEKPFAPPSLSPEHGAYVIYTSGSTGKPKGVVIPHRAISARLLYAVREDLHPGERMIQKTTLSFDVSVFELFGPLLTGGRLLLPKVGGEADPAYLLAVAAEHGVTRLSFPPTLLSLLLEQEALPALSVLSALRVVVTGGETVPPDLPARFHARMRAHLDNRYGPTEATISVTTWRCFPGADTGVRLPIGRPIPVSRIYLLDRALQAVPMGVPGELAIGGVCLARGYLGSPGLTAEKFVPDPFSSAPGGRLYRSGDIARHRTDGAIDFLGRLDGQVKVRGFRVELGEIEAAILDGPGVKEAAVGDREDRGSGSRRLVAWVVAEKTEPGTAFSLSALQEHLRKRLPGYMVPASFVRLDALPLTPSGKVDRLALVEPAGTLEGIGEARPGAVPSGMVEEILALLWTDLLKREGIGRDDDFFALGGHSLLATRLVSRVRETLGVELPLQAVFETPTLAGLAAAIAAITTSATSTAGGTEPALVARPRRQGRSDAAAVPLSFAQERLWFLDRFEPGLATYNMPGAFDLRGDLDRAAFAAALGAVVRRHEALRTIFREIDGQPVQEVAPARDRGEFALPLVDLAGLAPKARIGETARLARAEGLRPFDLARGPLLRAVLLRLEERLHRGLFTLHHIVADAWSIGILLDELSVFYRGYVEGRPAIVPALLVQYPDFALWQREWLTGQRLERQLDHWRNALAGLPPLELPADHPRPPVRSGRGGLHRFRFSHGDDLTRFSRQAGATLFMTLATGLAALLSRLTGEEDLALGSPIANRTHPEIEGLIGFFVNTLVLRSDLRGDPEMRTLLGQIRQAALVAYAHQELPFEKVVSALAALAPERDPGRTPLFQVMFSLQDAPRKALELPGLTLAPVETLWEQAKFDLTLFVTATATSEGGLTGAWEYSRDLFEPATIERLSGWLDVLLTAFARAPRTRLADLPLLSDGEQEQLRTEWSGVEPEPESVCLHQLFEAQARRAPAAPAVEMGDDRLTYGQLDALAERLADRLRRAGVGPETIVGICLERSPLWVVAILGVLKAGGAYLPLDPDSPPERLRFLLADAAAPLLVTVQAMAPSLAGSRATLLFLDEPVGMSAWVARNPTVVSPQNLAYVIYTSGSTGKPRGVQVTHANVSRLLASTERYFDFGPEDVWTLFHSFAFDFSVWEIWGALAFGGRLVVVPYAVSRTPKDFYALLEREKVTVLNQTPSAFGQLIRAEGEAGGGRDLSLRWVIFGGEALDLQSLRPWAALHGLERPRLVNMYGITETTVHVTCRSLAAVDLAPGGGSPIGRPIADLGLRVLDRGLAPLPVGIPGELCVAGAGLARGYLGRPERTAARFVPDPWGEPGARLYRSGDLVRRQADGDLSYLGRIDFQVKIRGFRIELGEIESALLDHPRVAQTALLAREDRPGEKRLVAYVVATPGLPDDLPEELTKDLRRHLLTRLPEYMIPAAIVLRSALPLTANGKVDRKALPAPETSSEEGFAPPGTPHERLLARIWSEILHVERVGLRDNFFTLGGDSILSIQLVARAVRAGCRITPRQVFLHSTLGELAAVAGAIEARGIDQGPVTGPVALTPIQQWFLGSAPIDPQHFNQSVMLRVEAGLGTPFGKRVMARLEPAWRAVLVHHDALRSRFARDSAGWRQWNESPENLVTGWARIDLSDVPAALATPEIERAAATVQPSLDLARGPLARAVGFDLPGGEARLLVVAHHLAIDGVSWRVLLDDLGTAYRQLALPEKTTSYRSWAAHLLDRAAAWTPEIAAAEWVWWEREIGTTAAVALPIDFPGGANRAGDARRVVVELAAQETRALLQTVPAAYRTRIDDVLLTALAATLAGPGGALRVDLEGHGREAISVGDEIDLSRTVGWFTSLYPVALAVETSDPGSALRSTKEHLLRVPGRGLGWGWLRYLRPEGVALAGPSPEVSFNYLGQLDAALPDGSPFSAAAENPGPARSPRALREHLLDVGGAVVGGRLRMTWVYSAEQHRRETVEAWAGRFLAVLSELIAHCVSRVERRLGGYTPADFPLAQLGQSDLDRLVGEEWGIEDIYSLSPLQEGLLFETLLAPGSGVYVVQVLCRLAGDLDEGVLEQACRWTLDRHPVLRSSFHGEGLERPLQVVHGSVESVLDRRDWRELPESLEEPERRLQALLAEDRERGFDPGRAPLMRWTLARSGGAGDSWLLWSQHHLLLDGWSFSIIAAEFLAAYRALQAGASPPAVRRRPYRDYIAWLEGRDLQETERYWRRTLAGWSEPTPVVDSLGQRRQGGQGGQGRSRAHGREDHRLPAALTTALERQARRHQLTLNTLVQGAWGLLLGRSTGVDDVVFGATVSGRPAELPDVEEMVGLFINTLPVRLDLAATSESLLPWLSEQQRGQAELRQHEHSPLIQVQAWSGVPRGRALFETILVFENYPVDESLRRAGGGEGGLHVTEVRGVEQPHYSLVLVIAPGESLRLGLGYDRSHFDATTVGRLLSRLETLLAGMAQALDAGGEAPFADLPLLGATERQQLIGEWSHSPAAERAMPPIPEAEASIPALFALQVARQPDATALAADGLAVSYGELDRRAGRLAHQLRTLGAGADTLVATGLRRSVAAVVGLLGVVKSGAAYLPVDLDGPAERTALLLADAGASLLLAEEEREANLPGITVVDVEQDRATAGRSAVDPPDVVPAEGLAYVIYTSGSTGRPKGVMVAHRGVVRLARQSRFARLGPEETILQLATLAFDASVFEIWGALLNGGRLVLPPAGNPTLTELGEALVRHGVTTLFLTTSLFHQMVDENLAGLRPLSQLLFGGEAASAPHVARAAAGLPRTRLINGYGPTEGAVFTCCWTPGTPGMLAGKMGEIGATIPIGRPIAETEVYVLDRDERAVPVGVPGELATGGAGLARGYLGRPDQTAERFRPHPFSTSGERLYRTGDRVRFRPDGEIEFLGRIDRQVKIRGFRIEPGEIEAVLAAHPAVQQAVVLVREDRPGERRLVAYVTGGTGEDLSGYLRERLPGYLVPAAIVSLPALPLTPNGKLDRGALPAPEGAGDDSYVPPASPFEEIVAAIWGELLGRERVGAGDDFFALGGHSLLATRVLSRVRESFGVELSLGSLFEAGTVAAFAARIESALAARTGAEREIPRLLPVPRDRDLPLSFTQERSWLIDRLEPGSAAYNIPAALRLRGRLDGAALAATLAELVRRHESLRTTFREVGGEPVQTIRPAAPDRRPEPLPWIDLAGLPARRREGEAARLTRAEARRPFDLAAGPLLRLSLLRLGDAEHVALLTQHHIVSDGGSVGVLVRELGALYAAFRTGRPSPLPEPALQYADFAVWQREWLLGGELEAQLTYWRRRLAGAPDLLALPFDRPRTAPLDSRGGIVSRRLPAELARRLRALGREGNGRTPATFFMVLLAAWSAFLSRFCGQDEVVVGSPIANRRQRELENLIGFFVNTLALRTDLSGDPEFTALLDRVRPATLADYAHQDLPFERLVSELVSERSESHSPLFQVMLSLENAATERLELPGLTLEPLPATGGTAKFDLTLLVSENLTGIEDLGNLWCRFEYRASLWDRTTVERLADAFALFLGGMVERPAARLSELPLLGAAERQQLVVEWRGETSEFPREATIHELFDRQAARTPEAVAAVFAAEHRSYGALALGADRLARRLVARGLAPGSRIGVGLDRSLARVEVTLAILKAGCAYLPVDPSYPQERQDFLLEDSAAALLLNAEELDRLEESTAPAVEPLPRLPAESLAYVIYTSGSTGTAKGVAVPHRAVARLVLGADYADFGPEEVFLQMAPYAFDAATLEIWGALLHGGRLVIPPPGELGVEEIGDLLARHAITTLWLTSGLFYPMVDLALPALAGVRQLFTGGDVLSPSHVRRAAAALPGTRLTNAYGPTENTTFTSCFPVGEGTDWNRPLPVGRPVANTAVYLLDRHRAPVPRGVAGELAVSGAGLAWGYLGRPDLTAERFVPSPFPAESGGERLYLTGDLARFGRTGETEFLGRRDGQVKVRGFRVEPGEIEAVLHRHAAVAQSVVVVREDRPGDRRLVAYVVPDVSAGAGISVADLRSHLAARLPSFMLPSSFVLLQTLPVTANGKVDRRGLPAPDAPDAAGQEEGEEKTAPRTPDEELLAGIFADVLSLDEGVGIDDDFFLLGGHSLLATRVTSRVREAWGVELPLRELFAAPTVRALVPVIEAATSRPSRPPIVRQASLLPGGVESPAGWPLSFSQQRLWFLDQLAPGTAAYNIPAAFRLEGRLDAAALAASLGEVARRQGSLRTVFRAGKEGAVQIVLPPAPGVLPRVDLGSLPQAAREGELARLVMREARTPFDLARGPLFRALLVTLDAEDGALLITLHHIIGDGWSVSVLVREVVALYRALVSGERVALPEPPIQYPDFALWQRRWLQGDGLAQGLAYWRRQLADVPVLVLPTDRPRPLAQTWNGAQELFHLGPPRSRAIGQLARRRNATPFMLFLAGFAALLSRSTAEDDFGVGTFVANRTRPEVEGLIGFFINNLALRVRLDGNPTFAGLVARCRETALDAFAGQDVPFEAILDDLRPERSAAHPPLFQVMLVLQNMPKESFVLPGVTFTRIPLASQRANFDLTLWLNEEEEGGFAGALEYNRDLFEAPTMQRFTEHLRVLLDATLEEPERRLSLLPLLRPEESWQILGEWSRGPAPAPGGSTVVELFAARAAAFPEAVALVGGDAGEEHRTYGALTRAAAGLAHRLAEAGLAPESPEAAVGVAVGRSPELLVALLGILAAGGSYVPLDLASPPERQALLLADAGARVVVTAGRAESSWVAQGLTEIRLDGPPAEPFPSARPLSARAARVSPRQLAYTIYTSGSTGKPKGVLVEHRSLAHHTADAAAFFAITPTDRVLQFAAVSFDTSAEEIWPCLTSGATLVLRSGEMIASPRRLLLRCGELGITVLDLPTAYWHEVVAALAAGSAALPPALRLVILGGERALPERWAAWRSVPGTRGVRLVNTYGPTEATIVATRSELGALPVPEAGREPGGDAGLEAPIGRAIAGTQAYVLAPGFAPQPAGIPGELCLGGAGLARGYLGRPDATAERFVPDPLTPIAGARLYRTGDLARYRPDGQLEFVGRVDHQVKIRGFRVEPGEVETALSSHPAVALAVVMARDDLPGGLGLVAYLVARPGAGLASDEIRAFLGARLPEYMQPAAIVVLPELPLRPSGKVDRRALPAPERGGAEEREYVAPGTPIESLLAEIWSDLLALDRVGVTDSFFALGGHSLLATQLVSRLHLALEVDLPLRTIFEAPTLAEMALAVEELVIARLDDLSEEELEALESLT